MSGVLLLSVVPPLAAAVAEMFQGVFGQQTLTTATAYAGSLIRYHDSEDVGGDQLAVCVVADSLVRTVTQETAATDHVDPDLTLHGLRLAWHRIIRRDR